MSDSEIKIGIFSKLLVADLKGFVRIAGKCIKCAETPEEKEYWQLKHDLFAQTLDELNKRVEIGDAKFRAKFPQSS